MLNIEKYKDEIIEEYQNLIKKTDIDGDGNRMNKAIKIIAYKHCGKTLIGASNPFKWLCEEYKGKILDDVEREYLSAVIKPFRNKVKYIVKISRISPPKTQYIRIVLDDLEFVYIPYFNTNTGMYKGMEADKLYSLEELGL